jgi:hypothetical protein
MKLTRIDERLAAMRLPQLRACEGYDLGNDDILVTCAGFEDRSLEYLRRAVATGMTGFSIVGIKYLPAVSQNRAAELEQLAVQAKSKLHWLEYDREIPSEPGLVVRSLMSPQSRLWLDVSGMSRLLIIQLVCFAIRARVEDIHVVYAEAESYPPSKREVEKTFAASAELFDVIHFISAGVFGIVVPPGLGTVSMYSQPIRLVAFPTFNPSQFAALCAEVNMSSFTIVHGQPPDPANSWRLDAIRRLNSIENLRNCEEHVTSTFDYRETVDLLLTTYATHGDRQKLVIAPTGSKMQSIAVAIVVSFLRDLQVVYPTPRAFTSADNYTTGVREVYQLRLTRDRWENAGLLAALTY